MAARSFVVSNRLDKPRRGLRFSMPYACPRKGQEYNGHGTINSLIYKSLYIIGPPVTSFRRPAEKDARSAGRDAAEP